MGVSVKGIESFRDRLLVFARQWHSSLCTKGKKDRLADRGLLLHSHLLSLAGFLPYRL